MTPTATPSAIANQLDNGTAITSLDVADHTSPIDQDRRVKALKDEASASTETNCDIHTEIKAKASTKQPSERVTTVAASHSHNASVGGLTSSSDATSEEEESNEIGSCSI
jgi:hypothetical protein